MAPSMSCLCSTPAARAPWTAALCRTSTRSAALKSHILYNNGWAFAGARRRLDGGHQVASYGGVCQPHGGPLAEGHCGQGRPAYAVDAYDRYCADSVGGCWCARAGCRVWCPQQKPFGRREYAGALLITPRRNRATPHNTSRWRATGASTRTEWFATHGASPAVGAEATKLRLRTTSGSFTTWMRILVARMTSP